MAALVVVSVIGHPYPVGATWVRVVLSPPPPSLPGHDAMAFQGHGAAWEAHGGESPMALLGGPTGYFRKYPKAAKYLAKYFEGSPFSSHGEITCEVSARTGVQRPPQNPC